MKKEILVIGGGINPTAQTTEPIKADEVKPLYTPAQYIQSTPYYQSLPQKQTKDAPKGYYESNVFALLTSFETLDYALSSLGEIAKGYSKKQINNTRNIIKNAKVNILGRKLGKLESTELNSSIIDSMATIAEVMKEAMLVPTEYIEEFSSHLIAKTLELKERAKMVQRMILEVHSILPTALEDFKKSNKKQALFHYPSPIKISVECLEQSLRFPELFPDTVIRYGTLNKNLIIKTDNRAKFVGRLEEYIKAKITK